MTDRTQMMFDILRGIQSDLGMIKREQASQGVRLVAIDHGLAHLNWVLSAQEQS